MGRERKAGRDIVDRSTHRRRVGRRVSSNYVSKRELTCLVIPVLCLNHDRTSLSHTLRAFLALI